MKTFAKERKSTIFIVEAKKTEFAKQECDGTFCRSEQVVVFRNTKPEGDRGVFYEAAI